MKKISLLKVMMTMLIAGFVSISCHAQYGEYSEKELSDYIQYLVGGEREVSVTSGRADLVLDDYAYEIDWANKWKESIGQSLWYALQLDKKPGIILILRSKADYKYFIQLNSALEYAGLDQSIQVIIFPNDFQELIEKAGK